MTAISMPRRYRATEQLPQHLIDRLAAGPSKDEMKALRVELAGLPKDVLFTLDGSRWGRPVLGVGYQIHVERYYYRTDIVMELAAHLHFPPPGQDVRVVDLTYGKGNFWTDDLAAAYNPLRNDINPDVGCDHHYDYRRLPPEWGGAFDLVVWDPPFVAAGTRVGHGYDAMRGAYGQIDCAKNAVELEEVNHVGLAEVHRVTAPGGIAVVKYSDTTESGARVWQLRRLITHAEQLGFSVLEEFIVRTEVARAQPARACQGVWSTQRHAANNTSRLFVLRRPERPPPVIPGEVGFGVVESSFVDGHDGVRG